MHDSEGSAVTTRGVFVGNAADGDDKADDSSSQGQSSDTKSAVRILHFEAQTILWKTSTPCHIYLCFYLCAKLLFVSYAVKFTLDMWNIHARYETLVV